MLQGIYTVPLQGKLVSSSITYGYCLRVHIVVCLTGLRWRMSYKLPKWQSWRNDRGESWKKQLFSALVLSFRVIQQLLCCCITYIPASLYPTLFMILQTKVLQMWAVSWYHSTAGITNGNHSVFSITSTRYLHQEGLQDSTRCSWLSQIVL